MKIILSVFLLGFPLLLKANDSAAVFAAGGLELAKNDNVRLLEEELFISVEKISIRYVFQAGRDEEVLISFPLPTIPGGEETGDVQIDLSSKNPVGFKLKTYGKETPFKTEIKKIGSDTKIQYYWKQKFLANQKTVIEHEYIPLAGGGMLDQEMIQSKPKHLFKVYCIERDLEQWMLSKVKQPGEIILMREVHYILTTANNWKEPIGKFKLTLQKPTPKSRLSLCIQGIKKTSDREFVFEAKNFKPKEELKVLFLSSNE